MNQEEIYVSFDKDIYRKDYSNFIVSLYHLLDENGDQIKTITCTGKNIPNVRDVTFKFTGFWTENPKFGRQFQVGMFEQSFRCNKKEVVAYFASPIIKGAGKVMGGRIYDRFGSNTFKVLDESPELLLSIKGMTQKKYNQLITSYNESRNTTKIYDFLKDYMKPSMALCQKIYEKFGLDSLNIIKYHPYRLCWIKDISFQTADSIAKSLGLDMAAAERMKEAAMSVLVMNEADGNLCMEVQKFGSALATATYVHGQAFCEPKDKFHSFINDSIWEMVRLGQLSYKKSKKNGKDIHYICRPHAFQAEKDVADRLMELSSDDVPVFQIDRIIEKHEKALGIELDDIQREAIKMIMREPVSVVTGGPGTGKTTIMHIAHLVYHDLYKHRSVLFAAPTGRAARRLSESVEMPARTLHSALKIRDSESFGIAYDIEKEDEDEAFDYDFVIVDEASFIDIWLMDVLLKHMAKGQKLLLVGDDDQLQSVGPGAVLRDILQSGSVPFVSLHKIFRQGKDSEIVINAEKIKNGDASLVEGKEFEIRDGLFGEKLENEMLSIYFEEVEKYGVENVACLCPVKDYAAGVNSMNIRIQERLNPAAPGKTEMMVASHIYRVGDLVMELKNKEHTANGDIGVIKAINIPDKCITVAINDELVDYQGDEILERLTLAYAMTVHKAQGSEYESVITCLQDANRRMCKRSIPYTSFSRGKTKVYFFGSKRALDAAIMKNDKDDRNTLLADFLRLETAKYRFIPA